MGTIGGQPDTPANRKMFLRQAALGYCSAATLAELADAGESTDEDSLDDFFDSDIEDLIIEIEKLPKAQQIDIYESTVDQTGIRAQLDSDQTIDPDVYAAAFGECPDWASSCNLNAYA